MLVKSAIPFYLILINLYVFGLMAYDQAKTKEDKPHIPEWNMMFMAMIGGGVAGFLARHFLSHKKGEKKFTVAFTIGTLVGIFLLILLWKK